MFINGIEVIDSTSFIVGFIFCMISDVVLSLCNFFLEKALLARKRRMFYQHYTGFNKSKEVE